MSDNSIMHTTSFKSVREAIGKSNYVVGVDEVGRGCIAGPLLVCAVVVKASTYIEGVKDSKLLSPRQREKLLPQIIRKVEDIGIGILSSKFIDEFGMGISVRIAILESLLNLKEIPGLIITDYVNIKNKALESFLNSSRLPASKLGRYMQIYRSLKRLDEGGLFNEKENDSIFYFNVKKADMLFHSVSIASVVAKVLRDRYMKHIASRYPEYHFDRNKGYGTKEHIEAIRKNGLSEFHRLSFRCF